MYQTVNDPNSEGVVLDQSPAGDSLVKPNTRVVLTVGRYQAGGTTTATTTTTSTPPPPP